MELLTPRLRLRPPRAEDAIRAHVLLNDPEVRRWNPARESGDVAAARAWCLDGADWSSGTHATWHAEEQDTGRFVANVSLFAWDHDHASAKVGYRVMPDARGRGIAREALTAVVDWSFADRGLERIQLEHAVANAASCRVALAAGFRLEGILRSSYLLDGVRWDEHVHGRLGSDIIGPG
jgi:RimJ/RimL family protein N-acetyltransferase